LANQPQAKLRISLVTPSFNQGEFIARTIDSVLSQRGDFELDYHVVDGGSTDSTLSILKSYQDSRFSFVSEKDEGQSHAINKGLTAARGDIVAWLNSDDVLLPGALSAVAAAFRAHPTREWLHGRCEIIDPADRPVRKWVSLYKHVRAKRHTFDNLITENYISQMTAFWRRSVHEQIGYLDRSLNFAFDYDLWLRLAQRGDPLYLPQKLACFRWYPTSKSGAMFERQFREDSEVAARYAAHKPLVLLQKRIKTRAILTIYRALSPGRPGSAGGPTR
jgi:glycosyltransferase involved in cell wall biosynthesis